MKNLLIFVFLTASATMAIAGPDSKTAREEACNSATKKQDTYRYCLTYAENPNVTADKILACDSETQHRDPFLNCLSYGISPKITPEIIRKCGSVGQSAQSFYDCLGYFLKN